MRLALSIEIPFTVMQWLATHPAFELEDGI